MTNQECMADLERITEVNKLKEQQAILKEEYIILKMKEESGAVTLSNSVEVNKMATPKTAAEVAREYMTIEAQINQLAQ